MPQAPNSNAQVLSRSDRRRLARLVNAVGERRALDALGISRHTMYRALAGLRMRRATIAFVERAVAHVEDQHLAGAS